MKLRGMLILAVLVMVSVSVLAAEPKIVKTPTPEKGSNWRIAPNATVSATHDSNVYRDPENEVDDIYYDGSVGLDASYGGTKGNMNFNGFAGTRSYSEEDAKDFDWGGENIQVGYGDREQLYMYAGEGYRRVEDVNRNELVVDTAGDVSANTMLLDVSTQFRRDIFQAALGIGKDITDKSEMDLGYVYDMVDYNDEDTSDMSGHIIRGETAHQLTDKSSGLIALEYGIQDADNASDQSDFVTARVGLKTKNTRKLSMKGSAGVESYNRPSGEDENIPSVDLTAIWFATDKTQMVLGGRNGVQLSQVYADNAAEFMAVWLSIMSQMNEAMSVMAGVSYRSDDYIDKITVNGVEEDRSDKGVSANVKIAFTPPALKHARIFVEGYSESVGSNLDGYDYDDVRGTVGFSMQY